MTEHHNRLSQTHILKIVLKGKTFRSDVGIRTSPKQTYGISQQSPSQFNCSHGLTAQNGYIYKEEPERDNKQLFLPPFSQTKYCSVIGNTIDVVHSFKDKYNQEKQIIGRFHRRKGKLGEFMDKNGWMAGVTNMMGFERNDRSREACNIDRQAKIQSARKYIPYINPVHKKACPSSSCAQNSQLLLQKAKIHQNRKSLHSQKQEQLQIQRYLTITSKKSPQKNMYIDAENLTNNMSKTTNQKQWKNMMSNIRNKFRKGQTEKQSNSQVWNLTKSDWSTNNQSVELRKGVESKEKNKYKEPVENGDQLKDWFNTTCHSNGDPWKYRKPMKVATGSDEEIAD